MLLIYCHWVLLMVAQDPWGCVFPLLNMLNSILATFWEAEVGLSSWLMRQHRDSWNHSSSAKPCPAVPEFYASKPLKMWFRNLRYLHLQWDSLECWPKSETPDFWAVKHRFLTDLFWFRCRLKTTCYLQWVWARTDHQPRVTERESWSCRCFSGWKGSWKHRLPPPTLVTGRSWCDSCADGSPGSTQNMLWWSAWEIMLQSFIYLLNITPNDSSFLSRLEETCYQVFPNISSS